MRTNEEKFAIIFDMDGTLTDSMHILFQLPIRVAKRFMPRDTEISEDVKEKLKDLFLKGMIGDDVGVPSRRVKFFFTFLGHKDSLLIITLLLKAGKILGLKLFKRIKYIKAVQDQYKVEASDVPIFEGCQEELLKLKEIYQDRIELGIVSTSSTQEILERFTERKEFIDIFGGEPNIIGRDKIRKIKPDPEGLALLAKKWGIDAKRIFMVGDTSADIQAGKNIGFHTIAVLTGVFTKEMFKKHQPDEIYPNVTEFLRDFVVRKKFF